jgi:hypothetical protein
MTDNTHTIFDHAIREAFADARVELVKSSASNVRLRVVNKRKFTLRQMEMHLRASGIPMSPVTLADLPPAGTTELNVTLPDNIPGPAVFLTGELRFVTHYGFRCRVRVSLIIDPQ